jgi:hypothetical protein
MGSAALSGDSGWTVDERNASLLAALAAFGALPASLRAARDNDDEGPPREPERERVRAKVARHALSPAATRRSPRAAAS